MINEELILNLVENTDKILYTFEKDGKFSMSSSIRNELFQEANASLKQVKEALAQPAQEPDGFIKFKATADKLFGWVVGLGGYENALRDLYGSAAPPHRPWASLTDEEVQDSYNADYQAQTRTVEAKLKEKNFD